MWFILYLTLYVSPLKGVAGGQETGRMIFLMIGAMVLVMVGTMALFRVSGYVHWYFFLRHEEI
jgi:hypothetical protein